MVSLGTDREGPWTTLPARLAAAQLLDRWPSLLFSSCAFMLVCSLLLGGGTRGGFLSDAILELCAIPSLLVSLSSLPGLAWRGSNDKLAGGRELLFCFAVALVPLLQLVPLPPWIWTRLPNRESIAATIDLLGRGRPWMPISVSPGLTWLSALSLLPPIAIFVGVTQLGQRERRMLSQVVIAVGVISAFLGLVQFGQGHSSPLRFFLITNDTEPVGFFANKNDFAALLYVVLLLSFVWTIEAAFKIGSRNGRGNLDVEAVLPLTAYVLSIVVLVMTQALARSRAGLILTIVVLAGAFAIAFFDRRRSAGLVPGKLLFGATVLAVVLAVQFGLYRILDRFTSDPLADARIPFARNTIEAAWAYMPFGAGVGTFVPVYATFEKPEDTLPNTYANHAHDDALEMWLESGAVGMILAGLFLYWLVARSIRIWSRTAEGGRDIDCSLARAATVIIGLLLAHSLVDYPLRTGAIMAIFSFSCAMLIEPVRLDDDGEPVRSVRPPALPNDVPAQPMHSGASSRQAPQQSLAPSGWNGVSDKGREERRGGERWGEGIEWPDEWRRSKDGKDSDGR